MKVAFFVPNLDSGGAEKVMVLLSNLFAANEHCVYLVLVEAKGPFLQEVSSKVKIINLNCERTFSSIKPLILFLRKEKPDVLLATKVHSNIIAVLASFFSPNTKVIIREANTPSVEQKYLGDFKHRVISFLVSAIYPCASHIVAVSEGVAKDMRERYGFRRNVSVLYNPIISPSLYEQAIEPVEHPWFLDRKYKVLVNVGRVCPQKDQLTLLKGFLESKKVIDNLKLVVIGRTEDETNEFENLQKFILENNLENDVDFIGFDINPMKYLSRADLYIQTSIYEGLPGTLIQALALDCAIICTDCLSGPREILDHGKYGRLIPIKAPETLAALIIEELQHRSTSSADREWKRQFSAESVYENYFRLFHAKLHPHIC